MLAYLTDGTDPGTDDRAIAPALDGLEAQLAARREAAEQKALRKLDDLRADLGGTPVVEVALGLDGRELASEAELDRLLADVRERIMKELAVPHRVRLKDS